MFEPRGRNSSVVQSVIDTISPDDCAVFVVVNGEPFSIISVYEDETGDVILGCE